ncbi:MAG: HAD family hydrolase [Lachnospiraceae bacterium]|nr:HAD family hydrolase [Lachnospiraceae bacterium]
MSITTVLFDLDGTLLPMDMEVFMKAYFSGIAAKLAPQGYNPKQLVDTIWKGTGAMIQNTGEKTNEEVFWEYAIGVYGNRVFEDKHFFDTFYQEEFNGLKEVCGYNPAAAETVRKLKADGYRVALATNPFFPSLATEWRIRWTGLKPEDFELYTTYENINRCKPNPDYYREVAKRMSVTPEECLMMGNDVSDDMVAEQLGMKVFLLTDCLINKDGEDISKYPHGTFADLLAYIERLKNSNE